MSRHRLAILLFTLSLPLLPKSAFAQQYYTIQSVTVTPSPIITFSDQAATATVTVTIIRNPGAPPNNPVGVQGSCQNTACGFTISTPNGGSVATGAFQCPGVAAATDDLLTATIYNSDGTVMDSKTIGVTFLPNTPSLAAPSSYVSGVQSYGTLTVIEAYPAGSTYGGTITSDNGLIGGSCSIPYGGSSGTCIISSSPVSTPTPVVLTPNIGNGYVIVPGPPVAVTLYPPGQNPSLPCGSGAGSCAAQTGHPINLVNGNVWITQRDYTLPGLGGGLALDRTWNSLWPSQKDALSQSGMFGDGWRSTYEENLASQGSNLIKYYRANGDGWWFHWNGSVYQLTDPANEHASLVYNGTTTQYTITFSDGTKRIFNNPGFLIALVDRNGNQVNIIRDTSGRISSVTDAASRALNFAYTNASFTTLATSATDSTGTVATYTYDSVGRLSNVAYPDSSQLNFAYVSSNLISSVTDAQSRVIEAHTYDGSRRGLTSQRANGAEAVSVSYPSNTAANLTDSLGNATTYSYSNVGLAKYVTAVSGPTCVTCGATNTSSWSFDSNANPTTSTDANSNVTNYTYDSQGNVLTRSNTVGANNLTWTYTYNSFNEVLTATDPLGHTTTNTYDSHGNLLTTTTPSPDGTTAGSVTTFTYDIKGQLLTVKDPRNNTTTIAYTTAGLISTITDAQSKVTTYTYDARGNRLTAKDALNNTTSFTYDLMNRLTKITYPDNTTNQFAYDTRGRRTSVTDGNSKTTTYAYDDADRLITVTDAATHGTNYVYDSESNLTSITDASNHQTSFTYNSNRWVTRTTFPSTLTENYTYDLNGNLHTKTDRKNQLITYTYDQLNRLTQKSYPDSTNVTYTYDNASRLTQVVDPTGTYSFTFDNMGRLTATTTSYSFLTSRTFTNSYAYDAASNRTSFTDPESGITSYAYDTLNRLQTLTQPSAFSASGNFGYTYDALSRRTQMTRPNSVVTNYTYDKLSRLLTALHKKGTPIIDGNYYGVDNAGNRTSSAFFSCVAGGAVIFNYDSAYQLLGASGPGCPYPTETFTYDSVGNRLTSVGTASYTYNSSNQLTATSSATYAYDNDGNTTSKTASGNTTGYAWDFENRLTSVTLPGSGGTVTFKYDPFGRRIYKSSSSGTSVFAYDGDNLIEETGSTGTVVARYLQGLNIDEPLAMLRSSATSYYEADGLGSITSLSNSSGSIVNTYSYNSFGSLLSSTGSVVNPFRFTARESDSESGLYFYRARYYDQSTGRFLSEDPSRINGDIDFYRYSYNSPTNYTDPFGLKACKSGQCDECPQGVWQSGVAVGDAYFKVGPLRVGGVVFAGVFVCSSNPTFNVPWVTLCGQGFGGKGIHDVPIPKPNIPLIPGGKLGTALGSLRGGAGVGGAYLRCSGMKCREDLAGGELGGFIQIGPGFGFGEGGSHGSCFGGGVEAGAGFSIGGFGCNTWIGKSLTF